MTEQLFDPTPYTYVDDPGAADDAQREGDE
jgi:hypothetical protein